MSSVDDTILARLKVQNVAAFVSQVGAASKAVLGFGVANEEAAAKTKLTWVETQALNTAMYTLRRYSFYAITALGAAAAASVKMGITFDESKSQATGAFEATLKSVSAARQEVQLLTADTHASGIQLGELAREAETMQSFGFALKDVNVDVLALANYAERAQKGVSGFESLVQVFDRIHQKGQLTSLDLRTLTAEGIPALQILTKQLGLTPTQATLLQRNKLVIPAQYALPALTAGIQGRSDVLGTNLSQQLGITHSYLSQIFGTGEQGIFGFVTKGLAKLDAALARGAQGQATGGLQGLLLGIDPSGRLLADWKTFTVILGVGKTALTDLWSVFKLGFPLFGAFGVALGVLTHQTGLLRVAVAGLSAWWLVTRGAMAAVATWQAILTARFWLQGQAIVAAGLAMRFFGIEAEEGTFGMLALNAAMDINPVLLIIEAVAGLGVGLYLLGVRAHTVATAFVDAFNVIRTGFWDVIHWIAGLWNKLSFHVGGFSVLGHHFGGFTISVLPLLIPGLAEGGNVVTGGTTVVGEKGPELLNLPRGAQVTPLQSSSNDSILDEIAKRLQILIEIGDVVMDGVKVGEVTAQARLLREQIA